MIQIYIKKSDLSERIKYVIRFLHHTIGVSYKLVKSKDKINPSLPLVTYTAQPGNEPHPQKTILNLFNAEQISALDLAERNINMFTWDKNTIPILGRRFSDITHTGWRKTKTDSTYTSGKMVTTDMDLFCNLFYHLSRYEEKWRHFAEETASDHATSLLSRYHDIRIPVIDILLQYYKSLLIKYKYVRLTVLPWPGGAPFAAALTHDVDLTRGVGFKRRVLNNMYGVYKSLTGAGEVTRELKKDMQKQDEEVWTYPQLIDLYNKHNIKATFFFITRIMEGVHVRYNINSAKFRALLKLLRSHDHEIGLHSSLHAFDHPGRYKSEKERLEDSAGIPVTGLRQHFLRGKFPRLWRIAENNGFVYDTSLGYNFQAGYRAGTTHPFYTYNYDDETAYNLVEFSLAFFEENIPSDDTVVSFIRELINQVADSGGLLVALLHPSNYLKEPFNNMWHDLIIELKNRNAYIDTLENQYDWFVQREKIQVMPDKNNTIKISKPTRITQFAFEWHSKQSLQLEDKGELVEIRPNVYSLASKKRTVILKAV